MREILFRGKQMYNGKWVEGFYVRIEQKYQSYFIFTSQLDITKIWPGFVHYEVDPETIGQYTEMTDKNGKKIFEGDIVEIDGKRYEVKCMLGQFFIGINMPIAYKRFDCEVIGNIHDNPELLQMEE